MLKLLHFFSVFNNFYRLNKLKLVYKKSRLILIILKLFLKKNLILTFEETNKHVIVYLKYINMSKLFFFCKRISKPSQFIFIKFKNLIKIKNKQKSLYYIISTNKGIMFCQEALKKKLGGFLICKIL